MIVPWTTLLTTPCLECVNSSTAFCHSNFKILRPWKTRIVYYVLNIAWGIPKYNIISTTGIHFCVSAVATLVVMVSNHRLWKKLLTPWVSPHRWWIWRSVACHPPNASPSTTTCTPLGWTSNNRPVPERWSPWTRTSLVGTFRYGVVQKEWYPHMVTTCHKKNNVYIHGHRHRSYSYSYWN